MGTNSIAPIGYYAHHHGTGHLRRAVSITRRMKRPVFLFCSLPEPHDLPDHVTYVQLPSDVVSGHVQPANSNLHYTPYDPKIFVRNQVMIDTWRSQGIRHMYVDVSAEVALLAKLYGLRVGYAVMPGIRTDPAHSTAYDTADYLLAHCMPQFDVPTNRRTQTPVYYSGGVARFKKRPPAAPAFNALNQVVVTLSPRSEADISTSLITCAKAFPQTIWHAVGFQVETDAPNVVSHGVVEDPRELYRLADVLIGAGGTNTIMEAAAVAKPFICIPEPRPYDEQIVAAETLERLHAALYLKAFPAPTDWTILSEQLAGLDLQGFSDLVSNDAAGRAARIIESGGRSGL